MKHLLIIFTLLLTSVGWSKSIDVMDLVERDGLMYEEFSNVPFTGKTTGRIQRSYKDGKPHGEWLVYYDDGQLWYKENYKDGELHGEQIYYWSNGILSSKSNYKNGKSHGDDLEYYENGNLRFKGKYKNNKRVGKWFFYQENGELKETKEYTMTVN